MDALIGGTAITIGSSSSDDILGGKAVTEAGVGVTLEAHGVGVGNPVVGFMPEMLRRGVMIVVA